jgi:biotin carboxyl carrier protein
MRGLDFEDVGGDASAVWCRSLFNSLSEGGAWGIPRSGLLFRKRGDVLVLAGVMPHDRLMPISAERLRAMQNADSNLIARHFKAAGIKVEIEREEQEEKSMSNNETSVKMPQLKGGLIEAKITQWCKDVGQPVKSGEILFRAAIDPNSAPADVTSNQNGTLKEILVQAGETARAGQVCATLS